MINDKNSWKQLRLKFSRELNEVLQQQHHAAQFLALAGKHLAPPKPDDSNTNMNYHAKTEMLVGNEFEGLHLALQLSNLRLLLLGGDFKLLDEIRVIGKSKQIIFDELKQLLSHSNLNVEKFVNELHYEIPHHQLDNGALFSESNESLSAENTFQRHNANVVLNAIISDIANAEPVSVWPHHFDTGTLIPLENNDKGELSKSIGLGWAVPDSMVAEPYFYLSFWSEKEFGAIKDLPAPDFGNWMKTGWNGGVLTLSEILSEFSAEGQFNISKRFFESGITILKDNYM